ncbi:MAG TPA: VanZ family protein [Lacunisphaera sp.]|jgi:VanZ family protein|nr:VanZ family protein [Lacunisphaera sp.]
MFSQHKHWWPVVAWMAFIFCMSTDFGTAEHTSRVIEPLLRWLLPHATDELIARGHFVMRKLGHLSEYAVLALLVRRALVASLGPAASAIRVAVIAVAICAGYAATDEFHQTFVPGRTPSPVDVAIDATGSALALGGYWAFRRKADGSRHPVAPADGRRS